MVSLEQSLLLLLPRLDSTFITTGAAASLQQTARILPAAVRGGFEFRLSPEKNQVDLQQGFIAGQTGDIGDLAAHLEAILGNDNQQIPHVEAWRRVQTFCQQLTPSPIPALSRIYDVGLEMDCLLAADTPSAPCIFFGFLPKTAASDSQRVAETALSILLDADRYAALSPQLSHCYAASEGIGRISHIGAMLSRAVNALRVNVKGVSFDGLRQFLSNLEWQGSWEDLAPLLHWLFRYADHITFCLDITPQGICPWIGIECFLYRPPSLEPRWPAFLDALVEQKLCAPAKRDGMLAWPGAITPLDSIPLWPEHLLIASLCQPAETFSSIHCYLSHIKLTYRPGHPLETKGYLGFYHEWVNPTAPSTLFEQREVVEVTRLVGEKNSISPTIIEDAIDAAIEFLLASRNQAGWWRDFVDLKDGSDEWVTAYVSCALAKVADGRQNVQAALAASWDLLGERTLDDVSLLENGRVSQKNSPTSAWAYSALWAEDADSSAWGLHLAAALQKGNIPQVEQARALVASHTRADGGVICFAQRDLGRFQSRAYTSDVLQQGSLDGWSDVHPCITANVACEPHLGQKPRQYLRQIQHAGGNWSSYWWDDDEYTTALAALALSQHGNAADASRVAQAVEWATSRISPDGAVQVEIFDIRGSSAFATALAIEIMSLAVDPQVVREPMQRAVSWLVGAQRQDGSWSSTARLRVPLSNVLQDAEGLKGALVLDRARLFTTATVLSALATLARADHLLKQLQMEPIR